MPWGINEDEVGWLAMQIKYTSKMITSKIYHQNKNYFYTMNNFRKFVFNLSVTLSKNLLELGEFEEFGPKIREIFQISREILHKSAWEISTLKYKKALRKVYWN